MFLLPVAETGGWGYKDPSETPDWAAGGYIKQPKWWAEVGHRCYHE